MPTRNSREDMVPAPWPEVRAEVWARTRYGKLPDQAISEDGLSRTGFDHFWRTTDSTHFRLARVQAALAVDRAAVARFRAADPQGAQAIKFFLDLWLRCLDRWERLAVARAADRSVFGGRAYYSRIVAGGAFTYGEIVTLGVDPLAPPPKSDGQIEVST
jgi:hypothetical protein